MISRQIRQAITAIALGSLGLIMLAPELAEAGVIYGSKPSSTAIQEKDLKRVVCDRQLSNLWSCNDDVRTPAGRGGLFAPHRCDHSYETARDGSRCGNRAADKRRGGR